GYDTPTAKRLRLPALKPPPKKPKFKAGDHYALRTPEECRLELARMGKVIDELIAPTLRRAKLAEEQEKLNAGKDKRSNKTDNKTKKSTKTEINRSKQLMNKKTISRTDFKSNEEFLLFIKKMEQEKFKYLEGFVPIDPEVQKETILKSYNERRLLAEANLHWPWKSATSA
ncbi:hypothetical protein DOY81_008560, partial [Sarcophaga bullata]